MAKVTPENLGEVIENILDDYAKDASRTLDDLTIEVTKKGIQALRASSRATFGGSGKYAKGWGYDKERSRFGMTTKVWNKDVPGLPHLLEYGHAKRGGGRVSGRTHIQPVEEQIVNSFVEGVKVRIT